MVFFPSPNQHYDIITCAFLFELGSQVNCVAHGPLVKFLCGMFTRKYGIIKRSLSYCYKKNLAWKPRASIFFVMNNLHTSVLYGSRMVPGKKNILSGDRHLLYGGRHLIIWRPPLTR